MTLGDFAQFAGFFAATTVVASCLGCLVDRSLLAFRSGQRLHEDS